MGNWIEVNLPWQSFRYGHKGCSRGNQISVQRKDGVFSFLIGDINECGGVCDDCMGFGRDDIVLRYRELLTPEDLSRP